MEPKFKLRTFRIWTYDVWGNARDGFDVNDRYKHGVVSIKCKRDCPPASRWIAPKPHVRP